MPLGGDGIKIQTKGIWADSPHFGNLLHFWASVLGSSRPARTSLGLWCLALPSHGSWQVRVRPHQWLVPSHQVWCPESEAGKRMGDMGTMKKDSASRNAHVQNTRRCFKACKFHMLIKMPMHLFQWEHRVAYLSLLLDKMVRICSAMPWTTEMIAISLICSLRFFFCSLSSHPYLHLHLLLTVLFHSTQPTHPDINSHIFPSSRCSLTPLPDWLALLPLANDFARNIKRKSSTSFRRSSPFNMYHLTLTFINT